MKKLSLPFFALVSAIAPVLAEEVVLAEKKAELGPAPTDFGLTNEYYTDCQKVVNHMRYACQMEKGNPALVEVITFLLSSPVHINA